VNRKLVGVVAAALLMTCTAAVKAQPSIPAPADWSVGVTTLVNRGSPAATTSVTSPAVGVVELHLEAPTGGLGVGTTTRQFDFTTTATASGVGVIGLHVRYDAFLGFFQEDFGLQLIRNGAVVDELIPNTFNVNPVSLIRTFVGRSITIQAGDTWGVRAIAGNFTECCGYSVDITLTDAAISTPGACGDGVVDTGNACDDGGVQSGRCAVDCATFQ
jgi:hypothetical protein